MGAKERILPELLDHTVKTYNLIDAKKYVLTDEEENIRKKFSEQFIKNSLGHE